VQPTLIDALLDSDVARIRKAGNSMSKRTAEIPSFWRQRKVDPVVAFRSLVRYRPEALDSWVAALPTGGDPNGAALAVITSRA